MSSKRIIYKIIILNINKIYEHMKMLTCLLLNFSTRKGSQSILIRNTNPILSTALYNKKDLQIVIFAQKAIVSKI